MATVTALTATMLGLVAVALVLAAAVAIVFRRAPRMPAVTMPQAFALFALGCVVMAGGLAVSAYGLIENRSLLGLLGSLLGLVGVGVVARSRRSPETAKQTA